LSLTLPLALAGVVAYIPAVASACGGTFCDGGNPNMPVDQTGEVILFAYDGDFIEAHIQIQYDGGDAEQFAWLVPVPQIPEIEVGSWRLVQAALDGTRPVYGWQNNFICDGSNGGGTFLQSPDGGGANHEGEVDPHVVAQDVVGAFEYAVLQGGSADSINTWLLDNGYATDDQAPEILDTYIAEGSVFVAFRLKHGAEVEDIHPVVIRYQGTEPCIPLRLTRVAAKEDMDIRALFLGDARVVPTNYRHVLLNRVQLDWVQQGTNYQDVVSMAVDAPGANGRAFITEYAGTSEMIDSSSLNTETYDSSVFVDMAVIDVVTALQNQGLAFCDNEGCDYQHELVSSLLHEFIPVPVGVTDDDFYSCLSCYAQLVDAAAWDGAAFAVAYDERIVAPLQHGQELLDMWPVVTRLYTRISPHEMTTDPIFAELEGLEDVPSRHGASRQVECCGDIMRLPGGRRVTLVDSSTWPAWGDSMPWAERVEEYAAGGGAPVTLVDETANIDILLDTWNAQGPCGEGLGDSGGADSTDGDGGSAGDGGVITAGVTSGANDSDTTDAGENDEDAAAGCGCATRPKGATPWLLMLLGLGLHVARRRVA
jgi:MYXO-CTERM domain-containing protein